MFDPVANMASRQPTDAQLEPDEGGFWARLFDFTFTTFITPQLVRVIYVLGMVLALFIAVGGLVVALTEGFWSFIWALLLTPVWLAVVFVILRVALETSIILFRTAQATMQTAHNTAELGTRQSGD